MGARGSESPGRTHTVAGRHVLGSSPESLEPINPASLPALPSADESRALEPAHTIYVERWRDARRRVVGVAGDAPRALLLSALDYVEAGWVHVRELQRWYDENTDRAIGWHDDYAQILHFIDGDVVDVFRTIADGVAQLVPGYPEWEANADPGSVDGDIDVFRRYLTLFLLAVEHAPDAEPMRDIARAAGSGLAGWCTEMAVLVNAIEAGVRA